MVAGRGISIEVAMSYLVLQRLEKINQALETSEARVEANPEAN